MESPKYSVSAVERMMKRQEVLLQALQGEIKWVQAAEILHMSARQLRRVRARWEKDGYDGLWDRRTQSPSPRRVPLEMLTEVLRLYRDEYRDFNVKHFAEKLKTEHDIALSYTWVKTALQSAGLVEKEFRKGPHRKRRERRPLPGMMLHIDGSTHHWLGEEEPRMDLIVLMDDATSEVYFAEFFCEEGSVSTLAALRSCIEKHGVFCSLYSDQASHYVYTPKKGERYDRSKRTQVQRALDTFGIELIIAHSPQARGRSERLFGTWQGRLPQELRKAGVCTMAGANQHIQKHFLPWHNAELSVPATSAGTAFVRTTYPKEHLARTFSVQHTRQVKNDNTIAYKNLTLQLEPSPWRHSFAKTEVTIYAHLDGILEVGHGPHSIGWFCADGTPIKKAPAQRKAA